MIPVDMFRSDYGRIKTGQSPLPSGAYVSLGQTMVGLKHPGIPYGFNSHNLFRSDYGRIKTSLMVMFAIIWG